MTTLVLSNHIPAIESALIAAGKPVIVCLTEAHAALRGADNRYPLLTVSSWDAYDEIAALAHSLRGRISTVATRWEGALIAAGFIRDLIGLPGQSMAQAVGFVDKAIMKDTVRYAGVPVARHRVVPSISNLPATAELLGGWPIIVKPLKGFASTNTHVLRNPQELASATAEGLFNKTIKASAFYDGDPAFQGLADQPGGFLVEEFVDIAAEYHCDGLWVNGEPLYQFPGQYHTPPLRGMGGMLGSVLLDPQSPDGRRVVDLSIRAAKALGMGTGFTHAEVYRTAEGRWLLGEIAARPGGGGIQPAIKHAYGVDVLALQGGPVRRSRPSGEHHVRHGHGDVLGGIPLVKVDDQLPAKWALFAGVRTPALAAAVGRVAPMQQQQATAIGGLSQCVVLEFSCRHRCSHDLLLTRS